MIPCILKDFDHLEKNQYGIYEPKDKIAITHEEIDFTVAPALAFNALGYRLGYGGGYYDHFLQDYQGYSVGMILKEFYIEDFIPDKNDIPVHQVFIQ